MFSYMYVYICNFNTESDEMVDERQLRAMLAVGTQCIWEPWPFLLFLFGVVGMRPLKCICCLLQLAEELDRGAGF